MNFPLLTKLLFTFSSVGGTAIGGYFATTSISSDKQEKVEEKDLKQENLELEKSNLSPVIEGERSEDKGTQKENSGNTPSNIPQPESSPEPISSEKLQDVLSNKSKVLTDEEERELLRGADKWNEFLISLEGREEYGFKNDDIEEDEENQSVLVADYIKYKNEDLESTEEGPVCDKWSLENGIPKRKRRDNCEDLINKESWGIRTYSKPFSWLSVSEEHAETALKEYGLINEKTAFKKSNGTWETGNWSCTLERSFGRLLVACDYYLKGNIRGNQS
ncbi:hypothetical protein [Mycoplasma suis]|uniref:Uncharacterized protein n=2 Tax=Mycoplasma suis TaxID=57372 RepID=F0QQM9_MYCSL|nr:hypothetical protein [Mycoplasma suis]ADX97799.1 hypothetical protein MSU_0255 [Mycoplasma suis str. Illinois]CBZ40296.1 hypothetical protein MSUIS_02030 [Mycoplasma suis KI3806]